MAKGAPLLSWKENAEIERLATERLRLSERIAALPLRSHLRIELTGALKNLTEKQLKMELTQRKEE